MGKATKKNNYVVCYESPDNRWEVCSAMSSREACNMILNAYGSSIKIKYCFLLESHLGYLPYGLPEKSKGNTDFEKAMDEFRKLEESPDKNIDEQEEVPVGFDINGVEIRKGDAVFAEDGRVQGTVDAIWSDGSVDIQYALGPGGPLSDTFDIKGHGVQKLVAEKVNEKNCNTL